MSLVYIKNVDKAWNNIKANKSTEFAILPMYLQKCAQISDSSQLKKCKIENGNFAKLRQQFVQ